MSKFRTARPTFLAYREGLATFDDVYREISPEVEDLARWFLSRWRCRLNDAADLRQEIAIAVWRALDEWDSTRGVAIDAFVYVQAGRAAERRLAKAAGWPRKGRKPPATAVKWRDEVADRSRLTTSKATQESEFAIREVFARDPWFAWAAALVVDAGGNVRGAAREAASVSDDRAWEFERNFRERARAMRSELLESR